MLRDIGLDLLDLVHFAAIGEARPVRFDWWHQRFRPDLSAQAARRAWERLKTTMRRCKVPYRLVDEETGQPWGANDGGGAALLLDVVTARRRGVRLVAAADILTPARPLTLDLFAGLCSCGRRTPDDGEGVCDACAADALAAAARAKLELRRAVAAARAEDAA
jgi:hypothetical protein